jgi:hypothetical protein
VLDHSGYDPRHIGYAPYNGYHAHETIQDGIAL